MRTRSVLLLLCLWVCAMVHAIDVGRIAQLLDLQRYEFPQEKIHVMTDRGRYLAGDTIRLRAWVVDAATHVPVQASEFVYVELLSPTDSVFTRVKLTHDTCGVYAGVIPIDIDMPEGAYQLTAYTMFMQSAGSDYFFTTPIHIAALASLQKRIISRCHRYGDQVDVELRYENAADSTPSSYSVFNYRSCDGTWHEHHYNNRTRNAHFTLKNRDAGANAILVEFDNYDKFICLPPIDNFSVNFYPEGGYLIPGVENVMTFKVAATGEHGVDTREGCLVDDAGTVIAPLIVEHDAMGMVKFTPQPGRSYKAQWKKDDDTDVAFSLPAPSLDATVLQVRRDQSGCVIAQAVGRDAQDATVVMMQRGKMIDAAVHKLTVSLDTIPAGVVQVMLFDDRLKCLSERLFFAYGNNEALHATISTDKAAYSHHERVNVQLCVDSLGQADASCAVSVIDTHATQPAQADVLSCLLLQSDLRGRLNNPTYYFQPADSAQALMLHRHLDMLMLTQGWRRYDVSRLVRGHLLQPEFPIEKSQVVAGRVLSDWRHKPVAGATVSMIAPRADFHATTVTDDDGNFVFALPLMQDSVDCIVMAENVKGKKQMNLELEHDSFPTVYYIVGDENESEDTTRALSEIDNERLVTTGDWRHVMLDELKVVAFKPRRHTGDRNPYDLDGEKIKEMDIRSIEKACYAFPGLVVIDGSLFTTGGRPDDHVSIVIDGEYIENNYSTDDDVLALLNNYSTPFDKEKQSHIFYPVENSGTVNMSELSVAASMVSFADVEYMYFARGVKGGTLYIEHKPGHKRYSGKEPSRYLKIIQPLGVQRPVEFYSPIYDASAHEPEPGTDLRATLYWNPNVAITADGKCNIHFYADDAPSTTYLISIEGVSGNGTPVRATHMVKKY